MKRQKKTKNPDESAQALTSEQKRQLELGKMVQAMFEMGYVNKRMTLLMSFAKGIASGFGAVVGASIVLALVLWFLSLFDQVPFIGPISDAVESALRSGQQ